MNLEALGDLMDGNGELAGALASSEQRIEQLVQQLRFMHTVIAEVHELADEKSKTPLNNLGLIRVKAHVALRVAAQSGLLS
jgi:hypothetical protein